MSPFHSHEFNAVAVLRKPFDSATSELRMNYAPTKEQRLGFVMTERWRLLGDYYNGIKTVLIKPLVRPDFVYCQNFGVKNVNYDVTKLSTMTSLNPLL